MGVSLLWVPDSAIGIQGERQDVVEFFGCPHWVHIKLTYIVTSTAARHLSKTSATAPALERRFSYNLLPIG